MILRLVGIGFLTLSLVFSLINPILGVVLIVAVASTSNIGSSLLVWASFRSLALYLLYDATSPGIASIWFLSFISTIHTVFLLHHVSAPLRHRCRKGKRVHGRGD